MFDELKRYKKKGHFFFRKEDSLAQVSKAVPELPGIYYIIRLAKGRVELVYMGKSEVSTTAGSTKNKMLKQSINGLQRFLNNRMSGADIDALDIYWFVTMDAANNDLPGYVEGLIMQRFYDVQGRLPEWNTGANSILEYESN